MIPSVILLGRNARGVVKPLDRLAEQLAAWSGAAVVVAMMDGPERTLTEALDQLAGSAEIVLAPAHLPVDRDLIGWARRVVGHWLRDRPTAPRIRLAGPLDEQGTLLAALAQAVAGPGVPLTDRVAPLVSPLWERIPGHRYHLLVCRGPRCSTLGAGAVAAALQQRLDDRALTDDDVLVTQTGCLFPCSLGPVAVVHPDDAWYTGLDAQSAADLVDSHLVGGVPLTDHLTPRDTRAGTAGP